MPANNPRMTKVERREAARREAERLAKKQAATERRNRLVIIAVSVVVVALVAIAGVLIYQQSQRTLLSDFEGERPVASTDTGGIPFGPGAVAGTTTAAATEVNVYLDFNCVHCATFEGVNSNDVRSLLENGDATVYMHPLNYLGANPGDYSLRAANAFAIVASDAPEAAYDFMQGLFANRPETGEGLDDTQIAEIALAAGVPEDVASTLTDPTYLEWVAVASDQARADGVSGTPSTFIDGEEWAGDWTVAGQLYSDITGGEAPPPATEEPATDEATDPATDDATENSTEDATTDEESATEEGTG